jgi:hypothetical protein
MFSILLVLTRVAVCVTILLYSGLLADSAFLARSFSRHPAMLSFQNKRYIIKALLCSMGIITYNLFLKVQNDITLIMLMQTLALQVFFIAIGMSFMRQSQIRNHVFRHLRKSIPHSAILSESVRHFGRHHIAR